MKQLGMMICLFLAVAAFSQTKKPVAKISVSKTTLENGKKVYEQHCLTCHQVDGNGVPMMNPPLVKTKWVLGNKKQLVGIVLKGLNNEIEIDGQTFSNPMPSQAHLTDQEIADVLTFVRNSFGNKASAVAVSDVKAVRATIKADSVAAK
jgi:mono/diheme cytochrome c family protein